MEAKLFGLGLVVSGLVASNMTLINIYNLVIDVHLVEKLVFLKCNCDNYRVSGALEKLEHETILQDRASDR